MQSPLCKCERIYLGTLEIFDTFDTIADLGILTAKPKVAAWRAALAGRPSVRAAVAADYPERLRRFLEAQESPLRGMMRP
jgi:glutathione S-transferase